MLTCGGGLKVPACRGRICREINPLQDIPSEAVDPRRCPAMRTIQEDHKRSRLVPALSVAPLPRPVSPLKVALGLGDEAHLGAGQELPRERLQPFEDGPAINTACRQHPTHYVYQRNGRWRD